MDFTKKCKISSKISLDAEGNESKTQVKEFGAKMGDPSYLYREKAKRGELYMLSSNFALYADMSQRVMQALESFSPEMEPYSIDEVFFLLENRPDLAAQAAAMRRKVKQ